MKGSQPAFSVTFIQGIKGIQNDAPVFLVIAFQD